MGDKRIKKLKKQMPISDGLKAQAYFHDMAAEGKILDEVGYMFYYFREEEPKDIRYATQVFIAYPSKEELAGYATKGWHEVSHWDTQFVFATEDPTAEELFDHKTTELLEVERRLTEVEKEGRVPNYPILIAIVCAFGIAFFYNGVNAESFWTVWERAWLYIVALLFGVVFSFVQSRRLRRKREELLEQREEDREGRRSILDEDWRGRRRRNTLWIIGIVVLVCVGLYYVGNMNEKIYDMPEEVSYAELPAVRLEQMSDGNWERTGDGLDPSREGIQLENIDYMGNADYRSKKRWGELYNYSTEYKYLPLLERKAATTQYLQEKETGETAKMETMYYHYRLELLAERKFDKEDELNMGGTGIYTGDEIYWQDGTVERLDVPKGTFDDLHVCIVTSELGERLHILARYDKQLMKVKYSGNAKIEAILDEINAVFAAQMK